MMDSIPTETMAPVDTYPPPPEEHTILPPSDTMNFEDLQPTFAVKDEESTHETLMKDEFQDDTLPKTTTTETTETTSALPEVPGGCNKQVESQVLIDETQKDLFMDDHLDEDDDDEDDDTVHDDFPSEMPPSLLIQRVEIESQSLDFLDEISTEQQQESRTTTAQPTNFVSALDKIKQEEERLKRNRTESEILPQRMTGESDADDESDHIEVVEDQTMEISESVIFPRHELSSDTDLSMEVALSSDSDQSDSTKKRKLAQCEENSSRETPSKKQKTMVLSPPNSTKKSLSRQLKEVVEKAKEEAIELRRKNPLFADSKDFSTSGSESEPKPTVIRSRREDVKRLRRRRNRATQASQYPTTQTNSNNQDDCPPTPIVRLHTAPATAKVKVEKKRKMNLFDGLEFVTTKLTSKEKGHLISSIEEYGGSFLETSELLHGKIEERKVILLSKECCTTVGYLAALSIDVPLLNLSWFYDCIAAQKIILPKEEHQLACFIDTSVDPPVQTSQELPDSLEEFITSYCVSNRVENRIFHSKKVWVSKEGNSPKINEFTSLLKLSGATLVHKIGTDTDYIFDEERAKNEKIDKRSGCPIINTEFIRTSIQEYELGEIEQVPSSTQASTKVKTERQPKDKPTERPTEKPKEKPKEKVKEKQRSQESTVARLLDFNEPQPKSSNPPSDRLLVTFYGSKHLLNHTTFTGFDFTPKIGSLSIQVDGHYHFVLQDGTNFDAKVENLFSMSNAKPTIGLFELLKVDYLPIRCRVKSPASTNVQLDSVLCVVPLSVKEIRLKDFKKLSPQEIGTDTYIITSE